MIFLIAAFDQITKYFAVKNLKGGEPVDFIKGFIRFNYAENTGMAFSLFGGARWIFVAVTGPLFLLYLPLLWYIFSNRCKSLWLYWSVGVTVAGGIGNLADRVLYGYVVDFIEPVFVDFAVFNIADCAVTLGAISLVAYLVVDLFKSDKDNQKKPEKGDNPCE